MKAGVSIRKQAVSCYGLKAAWLPPCSPVRYYSQLPGANEPDPFTVCRYHHHWHGQKATRFTRSEA